MKIYDISKPVDASSPYYPGDTPFRSRWINKGAVFTSEVTFTPHVGTHVDAPLHFACNRKGVGEAPLEIFVGPCCVIRPNCSSRTVRNDDVPPTNGEERVLFALKGADQGLSSELCSRLVEEGVKLVGTSAASVDPEPTEDYPAHEVLLSSGIYLLENLNLEGVPGGRYELHAAPLRWSETEASPVRAYLIDRL